MFTNSIICLDVTTLNLLYIRKGKILLAITYDKNIRKLVQDLKSYDDYELILLVPPLLENSGDICVPELKYCEIDFNINSKEFLDIKRFLNSIGNPKCTVVNYLECLISSMRMPTYDLAVSYGNGVIVLNVKDNTLNKATLYNSKTDMLTQYDGSDLLYGDIDLYDINKIKSKHHELNNFSKTELAPIIPLIVSVDSECSIDFNLIKLEEYTNKTDSTDDETVDESVTVIKSESNKESTSDVKEDKNTSTKPKRGESDSIKSSRITKKTHSLKNRSITNHKNKNKVFSCLCILYSIVIGFCLPTLKIDDYTNKLNNTMSKNQQEKIIATSLLSSFNNGLKSIEDKNNSASGIFRLVYGLDIKASIASLEFSNNTYSLQVYLENTSDIDSVINSLGNTFEVLSKDLVGEVKLNERVLQSYIITFR